MYFCLGKHWQNRFYIKYKPGSDHTSMWIFPLKMVDLSIVVCMLTRGYHDFRKPPRSKLKMVIGECQGNSKIQPFLKTRIVFLDISHHVPHHSWLCIYIYIYPCILCCLRALSFAMFLPEPPSGCSCLGSYPYPPADQVSLNRIFRRRIFTSNKFMCSWVDFLPVNSRVKLF